MSSEKVDEKHGTESNASHSQTEGSEIDIYSFHEKRAGRLIIDPAEAKIELGEAVAAKLKLSADGTKVLWPQPTDSDLDPQNWSDRRKTLLLIIITLAAIVPDFDSGIGIAAIFALAVQYNTTTGVINNLTSKTAPQVTGLYIVTDLYPFHLQARKLNIWTMGFLVSPFLSPFAFGFLVARTTWRWAYGIGSIYSAIVVVLIALFMEETMYDRTLKPIPLPTSTGLRLRIENLVGITGMRMQKYRISWFESVVSPLRLVWRPHLLMVLIFEAMVFGFSIGINVTNAVFLGSPPPFGYGFSEFAVAGGYGTPIVSVILGELVGRYTNDWIMNASIRRNKGVFEAESRLWACYIAIPLYICGFVTLGASFQKHLSVGALVMGWGIAEFSVMINTVAIYAYCNDAFPKHQGEISALINLARTLGGFSVAYFQVPWALKHGAIQTFGCEAAIVTGLFLLFIPILQYKGSSLRAKYSLH
uniref:MFS general substrate transporter n=1 Tax=Psilocybe cubensis TaxID=181762 RepID=A0A8H7XQ35_PSICU